MSCVIYFYSTPCSVSLSQSPFPIYLLSMSASCHTHRFAFCWLNLLSGAYPSDGCSPALKSNFYFLFEDSVEGGKSFYFLWMKWKWVWAFCLEKLCLSSAGPTNLSEMTKIRKPQHSCSCVLAQCWLLQFPPCLLSISYPCPLLLWNYPLEEMAPSLKFLQKSFFWGSTH